MPRARKAQASSTSEEFKCPECGRTFSRAAALGAHRRQAHGVAGASSQSRARSTRTTPTTRRRRKTTSTRGATRSRTTTRSNGTVDRDALLRSLFPEGIPAKESVIRSVNSWLDEAERLSRLR